MTTFDQLSELTEVACSDEVDLLYYGFQSVNVGATAAKYEPENGSHGNPGGYCLDSKSTENQQDLVRCSRSAWRAFDS